MNKKTLILAVFMLILMGSIAVFAEDIEIPQGQNATASLPMFSRTSFRIYEGTKLDFNIVDPDNGAVLIRNNIIIEEINPNSTKILISSENKPYEEMTLISNKEVQLNYTFKYVPFLLLKQTITHYDNNPAKRNIVLYFNEPFIKRGQSTTSGPKNGNTVLDTTYIKPEITKKSALQDPLVIGMILVILILILLIIYFKKLKKK